MKHSLKIIHIKINNIIKLAKKRKTDNMIMLFFLRNIV